MEKGATILLVKPVDSRVANSSTPVADPHLTFNVVAGELYFIRGQLGIWSHSSADFKFRFGRGSITFDTRSLGSIHDTDLASIAETSVPPSGYQSYFWNKPSLEANQTYAIPTNGTSPEATSIQSVHVGVVFEGCLMPLADGTISIEWAQNTAFVTEDAVLKAGSGILVERID